MADYGRMKGIVLPPRDLYMELTAIEARGRRLTMARRTGIGDAFRALFRIARSKPVQNL